jgi:hypothetical protein
MNKKEIDINIAKREYNKRLTIQKNKRKKECIFTPSVALGKCLDSTLN